MLVISSKSCRSEPTSRKTKTIATHLLGPGLSNPAPGSYRDPRSAISKSRVRRVAGPGSQNGRVAWPGSQNKNRIGRREISENSRRPTRVLFGTRVGRPELFGASCIARPQFLILAIPDSVWAAICKKLASAYSSLFDLLCMPLTPNRNSGRPTRVAQQTRVGRLEFSRVRHLC